LVDEFGVDTADLDDIDRAAQAEVDDAAEWAFDQPLPDPSELTTDVYAEETAK
jgi:pyruvate dehydrogenase E1 component alpha subunit